MEPCLTLREEFIERKIRVLTSFSDYLYKKQPLPGLQLSTLLKTCDLKKAVVFKYYSRKEEGTTLFCLKLCEETGWFVCFNVLQKSDNEIVKHPKTVEASDSNRIVALAKALWLFSDEYK